MNFTSCDIIFNPKSTGPSKDYAEDLKTKLYKLYPKLKITLRPTKYAGHAEKLAYQAAFKSKKPLIISSSGDGGYNEVINGVMKAQNEGTKPICAVLPAGNANDHSRTLQHDSIFKSIKIGKVRNIDLLKVVIKTGKEEAARYAHSYVGLGLTPVVAAELNKTNLNALKELWIVLKTFYKYRPFNIRHENKIMKLDSILFANINEMAKILKVSKNSKPDDGLFEVITFKHGHKIRLLRKLAKATVSGLEPSKKFKKYQFTVLKRIPAQLDGEVLKIEKGSSVTIISEYKILATIL